MANASISLQTEYEEIKKENRERFGHRTTCLFMQVGGFYEIYQQEQEQDDYIQCSSKICNSHIAKKDKGVLMSGFPI